MTLSRDEVAGMIDFSAVAGGIGEAEIISLADGAKKHRFKCAMVLPCYASMISDLLSGEEDILVGTCIGFPSGAQCTEIKVEEAKLAVNHGCRELDMVMNVGAHRSGKFEFVENDIRSVVEAAGGLTVKVILEVHYLTDDEIKRGSELCLKAGAHFVKTATGWSPTGASAHNIALIKSVVGDSAGIKASGGIRTLETLVNLHSLGATRFGIGAASALSIMNELDALQSGVGV